MRIHVTLAYTKKKWKCTKFYGENTLWTLFWHLIVYIENIKLLPWMKKNIQCGWGTIQFPFRTWYIFSFTRVTSYSIYPVYFKQNHKITTIQPIKTCLTFSSIYAQLARAQPFLPTLRNHDSMTKIWRQQTWKQLRKKCGIKYMVIIVPLNINYTPWFYTNRLSLLNFQLVYDWLTSHKQIIITINGHHVLRLVDAELVG